MNREKCKLLGWLAAANLRISAFAFGGGYVVIPLIRKNFVENKGLFTEEELLDMAAIAQSSPGAIAINLAALAGRRTAGFPGAVIACIAAVIPPLLILTLISSFYQAFREMAAVAAVLEGMQAGVCALIVDVVWDMSRTLFREKQPLFCFLMPLAFAASFFFNINIALILVTCAGVSLLTWWLQKKRRDGSCR